ncbi:MAG: class I SAM-dependent methyltransferase [Eubacteriales bacterium]|nr:class I SAM-dependent methyltransferase [Eubacteriales bacterium]
MDINDYLKNYKNVNIHKYPEIAEYHRYQIYEQFIGCGGLFLATKMVREMNPKKGDIVLDLGCGLGTSSIFLAKHFDVTVVAVDFWNSPQQLVKRITQEGYLNRIVPMQLDITREVPFDENCFDAIFCMNSLFMFGGEVPFLQKLLKTLKPGGVFCVGSECFNKEPNYSDKSEVPKVYNFDYNWDVWDECFSKYHSPAWWQVLLTQTNQLDIKYCKENDDGLTMWEDIALNYYDYFSNGAIEMGAIIPLENIIDIIEYAKKHSIHVTTFVLSAIRK